MSFSRKAVSLAAIVLAFALFSFSVSATRELLYQKTIASGTVVAINNWTFLVEKSMSGQEIIISVGKLTYNVDEGHCFSRDTAELCYDSNESKDSAEISAYSLYSTLNLVRWISEDTPFIGQSVQGNLTITNDDDFEATNISYIQNLTAGLQAECTSRCQVAGDTIQWEGNIDKGKSVYIEYYLHSNRTFAVNLSSSFSYFNGLQKIDEDLADLNFTFLDFYYVSVNLSKILLDIGQRTTLFINVTGLNNTTTQVDFMIAYPAILFMEETEGKHSDNIYYWHEHVRVNRSKTLKLNFDGIDNGTAEILAYGKFTHSNGAESYRNFTFPVAVTFERPIIYSNTLRNLTEGESQQLYFYFNNPNKHVNLYNISIGVASTIPYIFSRRLNVINESQTITVIDYLFKAPLASRPKNYWFNVTVDYSTPSGRKEHKTLNRNFYVFPEGYVTTLAATSTTEEISTTTELTTTTLEASTATSTTLAEKVGVESRDIIKYILIMIVFVAIIDFIYMRRHRQREPETQTIREDTNQNADEEAAERQGGFMHFGLPAIMEHLRKAKKK
jgi:hypothetical protein